MPGRPSPKNRIAKTPLLGSPGRAKYGAIDVRAHAHLHDGDPDPFARRFSGAFAWNYDTVNIPNNTWTNLITTGATVDFDTDDYLATSGLITVLTNGYYTIIATAVMAFAVDTSGQTKLGIEGTTGGGRNRYAYQASNYSGDAWTGEPLLTVALGPLALQAGETYCVRAWNKQSSANSVTGYLYDLGIWRVG